MAKAAEYRHGERRTYLRGCRCEACTTANRVYLKRMLLRKAKGDEPVVDAAPVRAHLEQLRAEGFGTRCLAEESGVARSVIVRILRGGGSDRGPVERVWQSSADRILALDPAKLRRPDGAQVDAGTTWSMIEELTAEGVTRSRIAKALGYETPNLQIRRERVTAETERRVADLHWKAWLASPALRDRCAHDVPADVARRAREMLDG